MSFFGEEVKRIEGAGLTKETLTLPVAPDARDEEEVTGNRQFKEKQFGYL